MGFLLVYAVVGLGTIAVVARTIGFRDADRLASPVTEPVRAVAVETAEIVFQSLLATYVGLLALGILQLGDPVGLFARLGLLEVVPLGFGAAIANRLVGEGADSNREGQFPRNPAIFAAGATFVSLTIAPTEEVRVLAARTGPGGRSRLPEHRAHLSHAVRPRVQRPGKPPGGGALAASGDDAFSLRRRRDRLLRPARRVRRLRRRDRPDDRPTDRRAFLSGRARGGRHGGPRLTMVGPPPSGSSESSGSPPGR
ncbi:hypothetical protein BRC77_01675 [Halobacteriales archaeon QH_8_64_26]|nr:MAG: hypothetical protein BRC77_01675 [Halobacteriales archaeon QH_8_64_26]